MNGHQLRRLINDTITIDKFNLSVRGRNVEMKTNHKLTPEDRKKLHKIGLILTRTKQTIYVNQNRHEITGYTLRKVGDLA